LATNVFEIHQWNKKMVFEWLPIIFQTNAFEIRGLNANIRGLEPNNIKSKDEDNKNFNEPTHPIFV
jgi:hypothetical protein